MAEARQYRVLLVRCIFTNFAKELHDYTVTCTIILHMLCMLGVPCLHRY